MSVMKSWLKRVGSSIILGGTFVVAPASAALKVGDKAPDIVAPLSDGTTFNMKEWLPRAPIVLYFYPKDNTPGCTTEACSLRDDFAEFRNLKATVVGSSYDSVESHQAFIQKHHLPFPLIADTDKKVAKAFGVGGILFANRSTFIINSKGTIVYANPSVDAAKNSGDVRAALAALGPAQK